MSTGKRFQVNFLILSASYILMGLLLLLLPQDRSRLLISYILAAIILVLGIVRIAFFFIKDETSRIFKNDLAIGAVMLLAGIYLLSHAKEIWAWIPVVLGFSVVFDSIIKAQNAFELKRLGFKLWWPMLVAGLVTLVLGALLILELFSEQVLYTYLAIVVLLDGVLNLAALGLLSWQLRAEHNKAPAGPAPAKPGRTSLFGRGKKQEPPPTPLPAQTAFPPQPAPNQGAVPPDIPDN